MSIKRISLNFTLLLLSFTMLFLLLRSVPLLRYTMFLGNIDIIILFLYAQSRNKVNILLFLAVGLAKDFIFQYSIFGICALQYTILYFYIKYCRNILIKQTFEVKWFCFIILLLIYQFIPVLINYVITYKFSYVISCKMFIMTVLWYPLVHSLYFSVGRRLANAR